MLVNPHGECPKKTKIKIVLLFVHLTSPKTKKGNTKYVTQNGSNKNINSSHKKNKQPQSFCNKKVKPL